MERADQLTCAQMPKFDRIIESARESMLAVWRERDRISKQRVANVGNNLDFPLFLASDGGRGEDRKEHRNCERIATQPETVSHRVHSPRWRFRCRNYCQRCHMLPCEGNAVGVHLEEGDSIATPTVCLLSKQCG